jgi:hypothetical protein
MSSALGAAQLLAVFDEILRHLIGQRAEHQVHGVLEERAVGPHRGGPGDALISRWKQRWLRKAPFQLADDDLGIAINVGADLQHRRAPIAPGQRHQIRPRHDSRNQRRGPFQVLQPEHDTDFFRERRLFEMVQDDGGGRHVISHRSPDEAKRNSGTKVNAGPGLRFASSGLRALPLYRKWIASSLRSSQ